MKKSILVIMTFVMMCVSTAVQAQHYRPAPRYHAPRHHAPAPRSYYYSRPYYRPYYVLPYSAYTWYPSYRYYYYSPLSVYLYDSWDTPSKIKIDCIEFKRTTSSRLRIKNGTEPKMYLDMYKANHLRYTCPSGIKVDVQTGSGEAKITVYSADGQTTAEYTL